jgi:uncharacterized protein DUF4386
VHVHPCRHPRDARDRALQHDAAGASEATVAYTMAAIKDWTFLLGPGWVVGLGNGLILGYMMYRTQLVPRAWTWLGLVGGPLIIISGTVVMFGGNPASAALKGPASIPEALWELFLGVYCTFKGFRPSALAALDTRADRIDPVAAAARA